jgi:hypothetical protein
MMLYLWLISRTDSIGYDEYDAFVVAASNIKAARAFAAEGVKGAAGEFTVQNTTTQRIGAASAKVPAGIVLGSFNAG